MTNVARGKRQPLDDGRWFYPDTCKVFEEATFWDGSNHISRATGSQWDHETLYRTEGARWILHWSSQWQGARDRWTEIDEAAAARWLVRNEHELPRGIAAGSDDEVK